MAVWYLTHFALLVTTFGTKDEAAACAPGPGRGGQEILDANSFLQLLTDGGAALNASGAEEASADTKPVEEIAGGELDIMTKALDVVDSALGKEMGVVDSALGKEMGVVDKALDVVGKGMEHIIGMKATEMGVERKQGLDTGKGMEHIVGMKATELGVAERKQGPDPAGPQEVEGLGPDDDDEPLPSGAQEATRGATTKSKHMILDRRVQSPASLSAAPSDYVSWLSSDASYLTLNGSTVTAVADKNSSSSIATFGAPGWSAQDGFEFGQGNYFRMNNVATAGTWTVFVAFKYNETSNRCLLGADPSGWGHFDTNVCFGHRNNAYIDGIQPGEFWMGTHYSHHTNPKNGGVLTDGKAFNDGKWHWVQIYGGDNPLKYSLRFDTGDYYENTNVNEGWMRDGVGFGIGASRGANINANVKDVIVYNRYVPDIEAASVHAFMDSVINGQGGDGEDGEDDQSSVVGDPHVVNVARERFEIRAEGVHKLVQIPRLMQGSNTPDLRVDAKTQHLVSNDCRKSFMTSLSIFGRWTEDAFGLIRISQGSDMPNTTLLINTLSPEEFFTKFPFPGVKAEHASVAFKIRDVSFHVGKHFEGRYGKQQAYLNVRITGLKKHSDLGGLLGYDDHADAEKLDVNCAAAKPATVYESSFIGMGRSAPVITDGGSRIEAE